jgi:hypothetical protein
LNFRDSINRPKWRVLHIFAGIRKMNTGSRHSPDAKADLSAASPHPLAAPSRLGLVETPAVTLVTSAHPAPPLWDRPLRQLLGWLEVPIRHAPPKSTGPLSGLVEWSKPLTGASTCPQLAIWSTTSPALLQHGGDRMPRCDWLASYLFDYAVPRKGIKAPLDIMLMSPHPSVCDAAPAVGDGLPRPAIIKSMLTAAKAENRAKIAIVVDAAARNAMAARLLLADRALTREGVELAILSIEEAVSALTRRIDCWDAIIVMPQWRGVLFALLSEASGIAGAWPLLWYGRSLQMITSETIQPRSQLPELDAPLLVLGLAALLQQLGLHYSAQRLHDALLDMWDRSVTTPGRPHQNPFGCRLGDADFISTMIAQTGHASSRIRNIRGWRFMPKPNTISASRPAPQLRVVNPV